MAKLYPYINYHNTKEALAYYEKIFSATNIVRLPVPAEQAGQFKIDQEYLIDATMHASFEVLGAKIFCADILGDQLETANQISLMLEVDRDNEEEMLAADQFYAKVLQAEGIEIIYPYEEQFWGGKIGNFVDPFGVNWMLHAESVAK